MRLGSLFVDLIAAAADRKPQDHVDFFEIPAGDSFDVPPIKALEYFAKKGLAVTTSYADMIGEAHDRAFTVSKLIDVDMLRQVRESLTAAKANGVPFAQWRDEILPILQAGGWTGRKEIEIGGKVLVTEIDTPWRLETIYRTNLQASYAAGQWEVFEQQADAAPYLLYDAVDDDRTRASHRARDGTCLPVRHAWWASNSPPLGYKCRCGLIQLDAAQVEAMGIKVLDTPPPTKLEPWTNPRTGEVSMWPQGVDPGFGRKVGDDLRRILQERVSTLPDGMRQAAERATSDDARAQAIAAAASAAEPNTMAQKILQTDAGLRRARAERQITAQAALDDMAKHGSDAEKSALNELEQDPSWRAQSARDRLADARARAREIERGK